MRLLFFLLTFLACQTIFAQADEICKDLDHIVEMEQHAHEQLIDFRSNPLTSTYDLKYHRLEWQVDPGVLYIAGTVTSYFVPTALDFQQINFDLAANMTVNEVIYQGNSINFTLTNEDNLEINLPAIVPVGQVDSIQVKYEGEPNSGGFGAFEKGFHQGIPVLWTLSEPYGAKNWWPCKQDLTDKIDSIDVIVTTPQSYRVASNGLLVGEYAVGSDKVYHWKHRHAIANYLVAIAVTNYAVFSDYVYLTNGDSIEILNYVYPESLEDAQIQLKNTIEQMELFNELFGTYPFADEKYGHAQFGWGGGMEHQTMSFMGSFSYGLQAHELAHQWFGDKITCGTWEDIWLNEGFASYLTGLTNQYLRDPQDWQNWKEFNINSVTSQEGGSVWVNDTTSVGRIFSGRLTYRKGALLVHMLRWKLGDDDFFQAVRNYLNDEDLAFGFAKTNDLKQHLETQSGMNLTEYFDDWFYNEGYPTYQVEWQVVPNGVSITLGQTTSHNSVDFFEMPVAIYVAGEGQDTILRLEHTFSGQNFSIDLDFEVDSLVFDPDLWLISRNNTINQLPTSTKDVDALKNAILISPNPVFESFNIQFMELDQQGLLREIVIFDLTGRALQQISSIGEEDLNISTKTWASGIYFISFYTKDGSFTKKLIKL